ncbi:MAG: diguanylate cyclase/phosphodiesterase with PAS/PAC sensor(s) [uncultured bacterium]|nr:MAG: diguanylate cyclase/phosphodiesterase with PAS/PAC sensor(s) [uncultured bacterium]
MRHHDLKKSDIINALQNQELVLFYQPQFNLKTSRFEGVEALIRWQHPNDGLIMPDDFLSLAEEWDVIADIGQWVLEKACFQNKRWQDNGLTPIRIAVNVYDKQFQQQNFVDVVLDVLKRSQLNPKYLELEIAENTIIHDNDADVISRINCLRNLGVIITLDDFGTGFSSISHLKKIHVDRLKIDKSFIKNIHTNPDDAAIVRAIIALASGMNMQALAEGVEKQEQLELLLAYDCHEVQGFYFAEALSAKETEDFLKFNQNNPFIYKFL